MNRVLRFILPAIIGAVSAVFALMIISKPAGASWQAWPSTFCVYLLQKTTAEAARQYLGITTGTPSAPADASEVSMDSDYIYFAVGDNQWVRVAVEAVYNMLSLEDDSGLVLLEDDSLLILEEN